MTSTAALTPIPQPKPKPIVGNLPDIDPSRGVLSFLDLVPEHGPIFRLRLGGRSVVVVTSQELVDELCDETRFDKSLGGALQHVRDFAGDGLFTAWTDESNWQSAHRILMPAFGPAALRDMFDGMTDIAEQLLLKWERQGPQHRIDVSDDTTRLTLDTIALCSFSHRFNSFYSERMNPFVDSMVRALVEAGARGRRLPLQHKLMRRTRQRYEADKQLMQEVADELIADRRRHPLPDGRSDILDTMLNATDPRTGERLSDENVRYQLVTFLIAGHETTSGLLTFTLHELVRHPEVLARARAEVDAVLGTEAPRFEQLAELGYLDQVLKESLRLWPTAPAFSLRAREPRTTVGGRYELTGEDSIVVVAPGLHRDPAVWGVDAEEFDPDRFAFDRARELPPNSWKPFGNGQRSCIGRGFALQEATLFLAMLLQRFEISAADPDYQLKIKQTLTIKPEGLYVHARRRDGEITAATPRGTGATLPESAPVADNGIPVQVLYGSNAGTAQAFAQRIGQDAERRGYRASVAPLDAAAGQLDAEGAVVIVTASYEGQPPDNAGEFVRWLTEQPDGALDGVRYTVFGCGNTDWARTYQAIPALVDDELARAGGRRLLDRGRADARGDFFGAFDDWYGGFWEPVAAEFGQDPAGGAEAELLVEHVGAVRDPIVRANDLRWGTVVRNQELADTAVAGSKRHLEIALPEGMTYRPGDYLAVLPRNPAGAVDRALRRFGLGHDDQVVLRGSTFLPADSPVAVGELLTSYVELGTPATRNQLERLAAATPCPPEAAQLREQAADVAAHAEQIVGPRVTVLDLLERYPACGLEFGEFLRLLGPLTPRQYSISSSPRWNPGHVTLTVAVLSEPALSGAGTYEGAASTFLAGARPGTRTAVTVRPSKVAFRPPESLDTPIVLMCAGSGIAPFRGFLQDRALQAREQGRAPAPALLLFGCHDPEADFLYRDELAEWAADGIVDVRPAFSAQPAGDVRYVQDRVWQDRAEVAGLVRRGAVCFVCGDGQRMAPAVRETCARIYAEATGATPEEADRWLHEMERDHGRYVTDVFA